MDGHTAAALGAGVALGAVAGSVERYVHENVLGETQYDRKLGWLVSVPVAIGGGFFETAAKTSGKPAYHYAAMVALGTAGGIIAGDFINFMLQTGTPWARKDFFPPNHWIWKYYPANTPRKTLFEKYASDLSDAVWRGKSQPEVRNLTDKILMDENIDGRDTLRAARAIQVWVQNNIHYHHDEHRTERFSEATHTLKTKNEDCDGQAVLVASMLMSVGIPASLCFVTEKPFNPDDPDYGHVVAMVETKDGPRFCETIFKLDIDQMPPFTGAMVIRLPDPSGPKLGTPQSIDEFKAQPKVEGSVGPLNTPMNLPGGMYNLGGLLSIDALGGAR